MPKYTLVIQYENQEAYWQHGSQMEQITKDNFAALGSTDHTLFISTRSLPPIHTTSFIVPENVSADQLKAIKFPDGVRVEIHKEA